MRKKPKSNPCHSQINFELPVRSRRGNMEFGTILSKINSGTTDVAPI